MKKILVLSIVLVLVSLSASGQLWKLRRYEAAASLGTTQFYGDIGGFSKGDNLLGIKDFSFRQTRFNLNGAIKYRIIDNVSIRANFVFGYFHSTDERGSNENRDFKSITLFFEPSLMSEYYFIKNKNENSYLLLKGDFNPFKSIISSIDVYCFTGFGGLCYNVNPNNKLEPFVTAGKGFIPVIPAGAGANILLSSHISVGLEFGVRFTFSDNIDGYTSQYSNHNDTYHFLNITLVYKIKTGENGLPSF